ncbi:hypothetical protein K2D_35890 [Planctomycetes bacterium K2D]|uniref:Tetratricopeptide repeat protein n=1 Tax=Botrimarina mediterranea TaxID=2528022 RepID=A0A518KBY0_9BACT|nr:hypothetical protein Spa11_35140 [Botrimarina mediterranea]QDV79969.1 hypothetical protein K2D_35890 [Planctomycetes bacterium K2D]
MMMPQCFQGRPYRTRCRNSSLLLLICVLCHVGCSEQATPPVGQSPAQATPLEPPRKVVGSVLCLTTETYPADGVFADRLLREIVRQGVLIAARDELRMITRDEALGERFPEFGGSEGEPAHQAKHAIGLKSQFNDDGGWNARLYVEDGPQYAPIWEAEAGGGGGDVRSRYPRLVAEVTNATDLIAKSLSAAGGSESLATTESGSSPSAEIESWLGEMNFASQFAAIRAGHQAIRRDGDSVEWLGVLSRSYAHLSALTNHTWSSQSDVFAARSLLYAERMFKLAEGEPLPHWNRAYVYAILGLHALALEEFEAASALPGDGDDPPEWASLIAPIAKYDHEALAQCAEHRPDLAETAAFAQWNLYYSYLHGRWVYEKGSAAMAECPEAYGVYAAMANWNALAIKRIGSGAGAQAFGELLPRRLASLGSLPKRVRPLLVKKLDLIGGVFGRTTSSYLSPRPMEIAHALREASLEGPVEEFSWPVLAELIAQEQFTQAANLLRVSGDAVEHSKESLVAQLRPLVEGHRYAPFVESHTFSPRQQDESKATLRKLTIVDPRGVMVNMLSSVWDVPVAGLKCGTELGVNAVAYRSRTVPALLEADHGLVLRWRKHFSDEDHQSILADIATVSPYAPQAQRLKFAEADNPDRETVKSWEAELRDDPLGWMAAAWQYKRLGDDENAIRCYRRSIDISPCMDSVRALSEIYYRKGDKDRWEQTLKSYLKLEDLGLAHAQIHREIANEHLSLRAWKQAEPHALEAAQTYSSWGLLLASRVYEGMQDQKSSEHFAAEASRSYPSGYTGTEWYFWTQRNGKGDREGARAIAAKSIAVAEQHRYYDSQLRVAIYRWLEGDLVAALSQVEGPLQSLPDSNDPWTRAYNLFLAASIAAELKDADAVQRSIVKVRSLVEAKEIQDYPNWIVVLDVMSDAFSGKQPADEFYAIFEKAVAESTDGYRCDYYYFLGAALEHTGQTELSNKYYGLAAFQSPFDRYSATLAGRRLVSRRGTDRGGLPVAYAAMEKVAEAKQQTASEEDVQEAGAETEASSADGGRSEKSMSEG